MLPREQLVGASAVARGDAASHRAKLFHSLHFMADVARPAVALVMSEAPCPYYRATRTRPFRLHSWAGPPTLRQIIFAYMAIAPH